MVVRDMDITQERVLRILKTMKLQNRAYYDRLMLFSVKPDDIIKYIERPEDCGKWPFDFLGEIQNAIKQISKKYVIDFPKIESQTDEDRVLSRLLRKHNFFAFGTNTFFKDEVTVHHVIAYMERDEIIYLWNPDFVIKTQHEVKRMKAFLF